MCSPGKPPVKKRKLEEPTSKHSPVSPRVASSSAKKRRKKSLINPKSIVLTEEFANKVGGFLKDCEQKGKKPPDRHHFGDFRVRLHPYQYDESAFRRTGICALSLKETGDALVPLGEKSNQFLYETFVEIIDHSGITAEDEESIKPQNLIITFCEGLKDRRLFVVSMEERVTSIVMNTGLYATKAVVALKGRVKNAETSISVLANMSTELRGDVNQLKTRTSQLETKVDALQNQSDAKSSQLETKLDALQNQMQQMQLMRTLPPAYYYTKCCTMNSALRRGNPDPKTQQERDVLLGWLRTLAPCPGIVWRGLNVRELLGPNGVPTVGWLQQLLTVGALYQDWGFSSTSRDKRVAWKFASEEDIGVEPVRLILQIQQYSGRDIQPYAATEYVYECETLLAPGVGLRVMHVTTACDPQYGRYILVSLKEE